MSDTVKLIIEIPKHEYEEAKRYVAEGVFAYNGTNATIFKAVSNGTPKQNPIANRKVKADSIEVWKAKIIEKEHIKELLDKIRADIELLKADGLANMDAVLNVIDRYFSQG